MSSNFSKGKRCVDCGKFISNNAKRCKSCVAKQHSNLPTNQWRENNPNWKGGTRIRNNRVYIYAPDHPMATKNGYILRARKVMSEVMGRFLEKNEIVHHIDGNSMNDFKENLKLFDNRSRHGAYHNRKGLLEEIADLGYFPKDKVLEILGLIWINNG